MYVSAQPGTGDYAAVYTGKDWHYLTKYELIEEPTMTLENMVEGTIVQHPSGFINRILAVPGGEGELKTYVLSCTGTSLDSGELKRASFGAYTAYELKEKGYTIYTPETQTEVSLEEIAKWKGVDVSKIRVKE